MSAAHLDLPLTSLRALMHANLANFERLAHDDESLRIAAVAIVIVESGDAGDGVEFLLTRRGGRMRRHRGQWALPGGGADEGESATQTARRELEEEVGLQLDEQAVLGILDDFPTRSGFCITPVVMWGGRVNALRPDPDEVDAIYRIPLTDLEQADLPRLESIPQSEQPVLSIPFASLQQTVFAPTAAMIWQFREVALHGRTTRVAHYEQPLFAWR